MVTAQRQAGLDISFELLGERREFHFDTGKITIGRRKDCDVVIENSSISRLHATVELENGRWILRDAGSVNGLAVRGRQVQVYPLGDDRVLMGDVTVNFHVALPVDIDSEVLHREQELSSAINVDNLGTLLESMLSEDEREKTKLGAPATPSSLSAGEIILIMRAATDAFLSYDDLDTILDKVVTLLFEHLPVNQASVMLFDENRTLKPRVQRAARGEPQQIRMSRHIANAAITSKQAVLVMDAEQDPRFNAAASIVSLGIRSAMCAPLCHKGEVLGLIYVDRRARNVFTRSHLEVLSILAGFSAAAVERALLHARIERERNIRERLSRYNAPAVIDRILQDTSDRDPGEMTAEEREITVLFADISGFTGISENLPARDVTEFLNRVFEALTEEVFAEGGTLDKFMGDAVMVFFGAPLAQPDHASRAVRAALAMQKRIARINAEDPDHTVGIRIGVNTGPAVVGDIGSHQRKDYTVIGDTVNTACRIESHIATDGQVVVGPETWKRTHTEFDFEKLAEQKVKGRSQVVQPYLVVGPRKV